MRAAQLIPPILAGATLILLSANALPTIQRKHRLLVEKRELLGELEREAERGRRLRAEIAALGGDSFCILRELVQTWKTAPAGTRPWRTVVARAQD